MGDACVDHEGGGDEEEGDQQQHEEVLGEGAAQRAAVVLQLLAPAPLLLLAVAHQLAFSFKPFLGRLEMILLRNKITRKVVASKVTAIKQA